MSAHVLLNLLNSLRKRDNTRARMLDSICHMTIRLLQNPISRVKKRYNVVIMYAMLLWTS